MGPAVGQARALPSISAIDRLTALLDADLAAVEAVIHDRMMSPVGVIPNLAAHLVDAGGKRIRPLITLAAARLLGGGGEASVKLAAAVEFIHSATLLHDDVVDDGGMRRGKPSANRLWGNSASVLVGDFLFARSFNLMVEANDIRVLDVLARAASIIAEGEVMQLASAHDGDTPRERYMQIIAAKTAALFAAAAEAGAMSAGADANEVEALGTYGRELGLAFQLVDDALDYGGLSATMGKDIGNDFREGKVTLPVVFARDLGDEGEKAFWRRVISGDRNEDDFPRALALLRRSDAIASTIDAARGHAQRAAEALSMLPSNAYSEALIELPRFVVERAY